jgi:5-carboxymethyl-2-hydroxymuconate isomerase
MPQLTIEYSANLAGLFDARTFARRLHDIVVETVDTPLANCKTRLVRLDEALIGDGSAGHAMVHVDLRILSGRTSEQKRRLGERALALLEAAVAPSQALKAQLTVEVRELDRDHYHKAVRA